MDTCDRIRDQLVDYADGELAPIETAQVAAHVESCAACRRELVALAHSLNLAQAVWNEVAACEPAVNKGPRTNAPSPRRVHVARIAAVAASLLLVTSAGAWWWIARHPSADAARGPSLAESTSVRPIDGQQDADSAKLAGALNDEEIERLLDREEMAARLAVSAQVLADQPGAEEYAQRSFRYLAEVFPNTAAGREAARRTIPQ